MHSGTVSLIGVCFLAIGGIYWASKVGAGVPQPVKSPPSIREGSVARGPLTRGHSRTRYFVGGGFHGGK